MTHYQTLGVPTSASMDDIRKAYRKLAMKHHPDRHPEGTARTKATQKFQNIQLAYDTLSNAAKRAEYDAPKWDMPRKDYSSYTRSTKHLDVVTTVMMNAVDWYEGGTFTIPLPVPHVVLCNTCLGRPGGWCSTCEGRGRTYKTKVDMHIPGRSNFHDMFMAHGAGQRDAMGWCGDLYIRFNVVNLENIWLRETNLHTCIQVPQAVLRFGGEWDIPLLKNRTLRVVIPARMKKRGKLRLAGYGVRREDNTHGDMLVQVEPWLPATFGDLLWSWKTHVWLGCLHALAPIRSWWRRPVKAAHGV